MKTNFNTTTRLEDIAKALKISIATVSRGLADSPKVKPETKKEIIRKAQEMGYKPNQIAKSLSSGKTNVIGVIIPRYDEPFFIEVCRGIDHYARKHNYRMIISSSRNSFDFECENIYAFEKGIVDGMILSFTHKTSSYEHLKNLTQRNIPLVLFDNINTKIEGAGHIEINDRAASFKVTRHLLQNNKRVGFIGGTLQKSVFSKRYHGYLKALGKDNLDSSIVLSCKSVYQDHEFYEIHSFLSKVKSMPSAFFCTTDHYAMLCIKSLAKLGYKVPNDVEVIGFGNLNFSNLFTPELTSVSQPSFQMGEKAAEMLLFKIHHGFYTKDQQDVILPTKIIFRETTKPI